MSLESVGVGWHSSDEIRWSNGLGSLESRVMLVVRGARELRIAIRT